MIRAFHFISSPITHITFNVSHLLTDADKQSADSLIKIAVLDIDNLLVKTPGISKGILFNIQQVLLKEWGPDSLGIPPEDTMQELLTGGNFQFFSIPHYPCSPCFILILTCPIYFDHFHSISFPLLLVFKSIRTGSHQEEKSSSTQT